MKFHHITIGSSSGFPLRTTVRVGAAASKHELVTALAPKGEAAGFDHLVPEGDHAAAPRWRAPSRHPAGPQCSRRGA
jgi:hypothetical protein